MKYTRNPFVSGLALSRSTPPLLTIQKNLSALGSSVRFASLLFISALALFDSPNAQAAVSWDGGQTTGASAARNDWTSNNNWSTDAQPAITDDVVFATSFANGHTSIDLISDKTVNSFTINTATAFSLGGGFNLTLSSGQLTRNDVVDVEGNHTINANIILGAAGAFNINGSGLLTLNGSIDDGVNTFGLTKSGTGTLVLSGAANYGGATTVEAGTLTLGTTGAISNTLVLGVDGVSTGTLDATGRTITLTSVTGNGTLIGNVNVTSVLGPGFSPGTINVTGNLTLGGTTTMELGAVSDDLNVSGALTLGGILAITGTITPATNFDIFDYGSISGSFSSVTVGGEAFTLNGDVWSGSYGGENYSFSQTTGVITAVPEPASTLLGGLGLLALLRRRRSA